MTSDLERLLAAKRAQRQKLRDLPIGEKLRLLDALRERALALRGSVPGVARRAANSQIPRG